MPYLQYQRTHNRMIMIEKRRRLNRSILAPQPNFASITQLMQQSPYPNLRTKTRSSSEVARRSLGIVTLSTLVVPV